MSLVRRLIVARFRDSKPHGPVRLAPWPTAAQLRETVKRIEARLRRGRGSP